MQISKDDITQRVDPERKHLEGLLKDRTNFHIVFSSIFIAGLSQLKDGAVRTIALVTMTIISILIAFAILRTYRLVEAALGDVKTDSTHPYTRYQNEVKFPWNANMTLLVVPFVLMAFFITVTTMHFLQR